MPKAPTDLKSLQSLLQIVRDLRGPDGCPWDKEQTHESLTLYAIEEVHELVEAIEEKDDQKTKEELGDVLFQVVLHSQLASERNSFNFQDVVANLNEKMVRRHPHVFAEQKAGSTEDVIKNWELLKKAEKAKQGNDSPHLLHVPPGLPALQRSAKIGFRTHKMKFDWEKPEDVWLKVEEELRELQEAIESDSKNEIEHELGDVFFSLAQYARHLQLDPEQVLRTANRRFEDRFHLMMKLVSEEGLDWEKLSLADKENLWQKAKKQSQDFMTKK